MNTKKPHSQIPGGPLVKAPAPVCAQNAATGAAPGGAPAGRRASAASNEALRAGAKPANGRVAPGDGAAQSAPPEQALLKRERAVLGGVLAEVNAALREAEETVARYDEEYRAAKRYMAENRGDIDPHEMFQNELVLREVDAHGAAAAQLMERLRKTAASPYFACVGFLAAGEAEAYKAYIGRFAFQSRGELLVHDWRAPISGLFYDFEAGPAGYDAPAGRVEGRLLYKRQFKIENGEMEYALESKSGVHDEVLQRELAHTADNRMQVIIATIQAEQNRLIRSEGAHTLLIQGVAGSGKTSIALHRIAYLLYRQQGLTAQNVAILSPSRVFGDYISGVLPELGEEPVQTLDAVAIAGEQLAGAAKFAPPPEVPDAPCLARERYKASMEFLHRLDAYVQGIAGRVLAAQGCRFGEFEVPAAWIATRFEAYGSHPVLRRLAFVAQDITERFAAQNRWGEDVPRAKSVEKVLRGMLTVKNTMALYRDFYATSGARNMLKITRGHLEWADVYPFLYLHDAFAGLREEGGIRHLVVDEMQDYTPVQMAVLGRIYRCPKTILGDFGQALNEAHSHSLADLRALFPEANVTQLHKSYRSSYEIMRFAQQIQPVAGLEPVARHGEAPAALPFADEEAQCAYLHGAVAHFNARGSGTMGILLPTQAEAAALHAELAECGDVQLLTPQSTRFGAGVTVACIAAAKGLEFDEVVVPCAAAATYHTEHHSRLLYVACTRALHRLTLCYVGEPSPLVARAVAG